MRIRVRYNHTRMVRKIVPSEYFIIITFLLLLLLGYVIIIINGQKLLGSTRLSS